MDKLMRLILLFLALAVVCLGIGAWLVLKEFGSGWPDLGKASLGLGTAFAVGGVGAALLKQAEQWRSDRSAWADLLAQFVGVHHTVELARQLIGAHKSVATYRDQSAALVQARLTLRQIRRDPLVANDNQQHNEATTLEHELKLLQDYLDRLGTEYALHYLWVARQQRIDDVWLTNECAKLAGGADAVDQGHAVYQPTTAWTELTSKKRFPRLVEFLGSEFDNSAFMSGVKAVKPRLEKRAGIVVRPGGYEPEPLTTPLSSSTQGPLA